MIKKALTDKDYSLILNYALGGAGLGGAAALATCLIDYAKRISNDKKESESDDDDTLYIKTKSNKNVIKQAGLLDPLKDWLHGEDGRNVVFSGPGAITAAALSALGSWALVNTIYKHHLLTEAQKELDEAQTQYIDVNGFERVKKAAENKNNMGIASNILSLLLAVPGIAGIASGVIAYKALDKYFPTPKKKVTSPRRIKIVTGDEEFLAGDKSKVDQIPVEYNSPNVSDDPMAKQAGIENSDGVELMLHTLSVSNLKDSDVINMIGDVAKSGSYSFEKYAGVIGFTEAAGNTKGRGDYECEDLNKQLAITYLAKSASLGEQVAITAAAEFAEAYPFFYKTAAALPDKQKDNLYKYACALGKAIRMNVICSELNISENAIDKKASMLVDDNDMLNMLDKLNDIKPDEDSDDDQSNQTDEKKKKNIPKFVTSTKTGLRLEKAISDLDDIDKILNPSL